LHSKSSNLGEFGKSRDLCPQLSTTRLSQKTFGKLSSQLAINIFGYAMKPGDVI